ncbi:MAG: hypothetical protein WC752_01315 [Patescibacteria group bacterium]|jgi:SAM-dependent methyltransferase
MWFTFLLILLFLVILSAAYAGFKGAPWVPTYKKDITRIIKIAQIKAEDNFYDLGCGDGRVVAAAAKAGAKCFGYEISILPYLIAKLRTFRLKNAHIYFKNYNSADLSKADIVYLFLMPKINIQIKDKLMQTMKKNAKVIAYIWPIPGWQPASVSQEEGGSKVFLYRIRKD